MGKKLKRKLFSRELDDQAKVFSLASHKNYSPNFRLSVMLKEKIDIKILQKALEIALNKYKAFKVKMKKGVFWHYFKENDKKPIISIDKKDLLKKINTKENNDYLFKVTYLKNKINIDFFHSLTDGSGGTEFLKEIVYRYLELKYPNDLEVRDLEISQTDKSTENAYTKVYKKNSKKSDTSQIAYMIKGEELPEGEIGINHFNINLEEIRNSTKEKACSLSMYLVAMIAYSIYETNYKENKGKRPINICVPINLKKYFTSETISNFFSYMSITIKLRKHYVYTFDNILDIVKKEFNRKLKIEKIIETMSTDAGVTKNPFVHIVPLFIKKVVVRLGALEVKRHFTMTVSNVGEFQVDNKYSKYIEKFFVLLAPDWAEKVKCGVCSYGENMVVTFGNALKNNLIESRFKDLLIENNINFKVEKNSLL